MDEWIDVSIEADLDAPELLSLLNDPLLAGGWQEEGRLHLYWRRDQWNPETIGMITQLMAPLIRTGSGQISLASMPNQDWNRAWADSVTPIRIGRRVVIRPSWQHVAVEPDDIVIVLDPKQAFGTGHHATTHMLLEWLQDHIKGGERVLDVGTGSGILSMAALRLGAASAVGIDIDPVAIECAQAYAEENGFGDELTLKVAPLVDITPMEFDVILANLDRGTLLDLKASLCAHVSPSGRLVVSGLVSDDRSGMLQAFGGAGAALQHERERAGWLALQFTCSSTEAS